jgi:hypothetical protein
MFRILFRALNKLHNLICDVGGDNGYSSDDIDIVRSSGPGV